MPDRTPAGRRLPWRGLAIAVAAAAVAAATTATAQELIDGRNLVNGSVTRAKLQVNAIGNAQIAAGAVTTSDIRSRAVRAANIGNGAVQNAAIANGAVTRGKIARNSVDGDRILDGSITAADIGPGAALPAVTTRALEVTIPSGTGQAADVSCLPGEVALGGGYASIPPVNANVLNDRPIPAANGTRPTGWSVFVNNSTGAPTQVVVYAVCARR